MDKPRPDIRARLIELSRHWDTLEGRLAYVVLTGFHYHGQKLAEFVAKRHGWAEDNGGNGVLYPDDLDDYERVTLGRQIPDGFVEIYIRWGARKDGFEDHVDEAVYAAAVADLLRNEKAHTEPLF